MSDAADGGGVSDAAARELLESMVAIPSPTGEERAAAEHLRDFLRDHGREAWLDDVGNVRAPADDAVLLTSHVDTVPGDVPVGIDGPDETDDPVPWGGDDEAPQDAAVLRGRGSVDATGPLCAMAVAAVRTGVSFVGVVGEETDSRGARHLVAEREVPDAVVNGEPSGWDALTLGYRGFLAGTYRVETEAGHTSRPELNAIQHAMAWWNRVEAAFDSPDDAVFESVTAKPVDVSGGVADDGLSVAATVDVQFRIPPGSSAEEIREVVEAELDAGTVEWRDAIPPVLDSPRSAVGRAFRVGIRERGGSPRLLKKTGTADVNLFAGAWDCPMATYGPGDSALDHAPDERLALPEYDRAIAVLETVCDDLQ
ncbi:[LysW]-lysine hydrolase [Haloarchaeobius iranensis]|uniref:Putative [LysW]-lysine/[LysW]-ornithine hydrolase n=1 Tax=Haloarchaeobius iranensis TaxID=996166 RepID=A0A1G9VKN9_9EURY|nr:[LysW]-lysine hydrolase [Haloarchaeobius iranensis]SDM72677.1 acetylornithine deacetylase [Haloarchaeobius iranensis]